jgi:triacylglycerol lipase
MSHVWSPEVPRAEQLCAAHGQNVPTTPRRVLGAARAAVQTMRRAVVVQANEAALMMSTVAMVPLRLLGGGYETASGSSPSVRALTASITRPVLLVHGFAGTKSSLALVAHALSARGLTVEAMSYPPLGMSVKQLAERVVAEVERILVTTDTDKVHLVGHSLGGVVIALAIADSRLTGRVDTVITLGSPFGGSPWAGVLPFAEIMRELRAGSPLLRRLAATPVPDGVRWLSLAAALDIVVPGMRSLPSHAQVETITFDGVGHLGMLVSRQVISCIAAELCARRSAGAERMQVLPSAS